MRMLKEMVLSILIAGSTSSAAFGMHSYSCLVDYVYSGVPEFVRTHLEDEPSKREKEIFVSGTSLTGETLLHTVIGYHDLACIRILLESVPEEHRIEYILTKDGKGYTALHRAVFCGCADEVALLLEFIPVEKRAAIISARGDHDATALYFAVVCKYPQIIRILIESVPEKQRISVLWLKA